MIEMQLEWTLEAHYMEDTLFSSKWKYRASVTKNIQSFFFEAEFQNNFSNEKREILWKDTAIHWDLAELTAALNRYNLSCL